jgi:hypothetical protein
LRVSKERHISNAQVRVTTSGSMTRALFPRWCEHFVRNLPAGLGKGGEAVFLYVDGHTSRWTYAGLEFLAANNVIVICVPSHTTIWSQPNDAGQNAAFKAYFAKCCRAWRAAPDGSLAHLHSVMDRGDFNEIFVKAQYGPRAEQAARLRQTGMNAMKSGWVNVGMPRSTGTAFSGESPSFSRNGTGT